MQRIVRIRKSVPTEVEAAFTAGYRKGEYEAYHRNHTEIRDLKARVQQLENQQKEFFGGVSDFVPIDFTGTTVSEGEEFTVSLVDSDTRDAIRAGGWEEVFREDDRILEDIIGQFDTTISIRDHRPAQPYYRQFGRGFTRGGVVR